MTMYLSTVQKKGKVGRFHEYALANISHWKTIAIVIALHNIVATCVELKYCWHMRNSNRSHIHISKITCHYILNKILVMKPLP